jgi:integration host factor subunit beta
MSDQTEHKTMTKADLIKEVAQSSDLTKKHSEIIVNTVFESIIDALHRNDKVELRGFGSFRIRQRQARQGRNPKTGEKVKVPAKKIPYFKPGKEFKRFINGTEGGADTEDTSVASTSSTFGSTPLYPVDRDS